MENIKRNLNTLLKKLLNEKNINQEIRNNIHELIELMNSIKINYTTIPGNYRKFMKYLEKYYGFEFDCTYDCTLPIYMENLHSIYNQLQLMWIDYVIGEEVNAESYKIKEAINGIKMPEWIINGGRGQIFEDYELIDLLTVFENFYTDNLEVDV